MFSFLADSNRSCHWAGIFFLFYRKISVWDVAFAMCSKHMADIVRSREQVFVTHAARPPHLWRWQHSGNSLLGTGRGHAFVRPLYSIGPTNYGKSWFILPYYAPYLCPPEPPGSRWVRIISRNPTHIFSYLFWNKYRRMLYICEVVFIS